MYNTEQMGKLVSNNFTSTAILITFFLSSLLIGKAIATAFTNATRVEPVLANNSNVCPDGGGWTKIDSGDLSQYPVDGATQYCFKAGLFKTDTIPQDGFGQEGACEAGHIERCELSHWSYFIPQETPTATPTSSPAPTPDPRFSVGSCLVQNTNLFRFRTVNFSVAGEYRLKGNSSGNTIGIGNVNPGDEVGGYTNNALSTSTEDTWLKQFKDGSSWVGAGGTHVTSIAGHTQNEFFCPVEETPEPSEEPTPSPAESPTPTPSPTPTDHNFQFGGPPPPPDVEGEVLGAQVLGLSDTSSGGSNLNPYLFWLGIIMLTAGVKQTGEYLYARKSS